MTSAFSLGTIVVLGLILIIGMALSRKLGAIILLVYVVAFLAVVSGVFPGVTLG